MTHFTPVAALIGGALIGLASAIFLLAHGRICGISGIFGGFLDRFWVRADGSEGDGARSLVNFCFVAGLLVGGVALRLCVPSAFATTWMPSLKVAAAAGLLVGIGTRVGNGCTSGHGVCGISRLSARSIVATSLFMGAAIACVYLTRHWGAS